MNLSPTCAALAPILDVPINDHKLCSTVRRVPILSHIGWLQACTSGLRRFQVMKELSLKPAIGCCEKLFSRHFVYRPSSSICCIQLGPKQMSVNMNQDLEVTRYINSIQQIPRLSRERELELCRLWVSDHDEQAKDELVRANLRYVVAIALKYRRYGLPLADLMAEGSIGIMHALTKFEPEREFRFVTYSAYWIRACILSYIIRSWSMVGGGSGALRSKMFFKLRREKVRITNLVGDGEEADRMLAERLNMPQEQVMAMLNRLELRDISLDTPVYDNGVATLVDTLPSSDTSQEEIFSNSQGKKQTQNVVRAALDTLDRRERFIVEHRLMADTEEEKSLAELGRVLGVSRERARQIEVRAKRKLKVRIGEMIANAGLDTESLVNAA